MKAFCNRFESFVFNLWMNSTKEVHDLHDLLAAVVSVLRAGNPCTVTPVHTFTTITINTNYSHRHTYQWLDTTTAADISWFTRSLQMVCINGSTLHAMSGKHMNQSFI